MFACEHSQADGWRVGVAGGGAGDVSYGEGEARERTALCGPAVRGHGLWTGSYERGAR